MADVYKLLDAGTLPVSTVQFKDYIRVPQSMVSQDSVITTMLASAVAWGERYTRREFRDNTYTLTMDAFPTTICLRRDPVASITSIVYKIDDVDTTVDASTYYLLKGVQTSSIVLNDGEVWPADGDETTIGLLGSIVVTFETEPFSCEGEIKLAIMQHTANLWAERGDCTVASAAKDSGATGIYDGFRVARI